MHRPIPLLIITLVTPGLIPLPAPAQDEPQAHVNQVELGIGQVSDDAYRFGRYNGLQKQGPYAIGDINARGSGEDDRFWRLRGTNLGLESRYLRLDAGVRGRQAYFFEYDQLPNYKDDTGRTPFLGIGDATLTLPDGFDINTNLDANLRPVELETERKRLGLGAAFTSRKYWKLDVAYQHETKDGIDQRGSSMANGAQGLVGNTTAALLPEPVDFTTNMVDVALNYAKDNAQLQLAYHMSLFDNDEFALTWEDPFFPQRYASQALAPDNQFHQLALTGAYLLPYRSRISGTFSLGRMTQDQNFQPYTVNPALDSGLPRASLDGEVWVSTAKLKVDSRPVRKLQLSAQYRYDDRDNDTPVETYDYVVADSFPATPLKNNPLSYTRNQVDLTANYRINPTMSLRGGYQYEHMSRDYRQEEREETREHTLSGRWKLQPHNKVDISLYAEAGERDGSNYKAPAEENPALRKYYLADRDRTRLGSSIDLLATDTLSLSARAEYIKDDYNDSEIGLIDSKEPTYTLDASYQPRSNITTYAYYTFQDIKSTQKGSEAGTSTADWEADFKDRTHTLGVGGKLTGIRGKWDIGADIVLTKASGEVDMEKDFATGIPVTQYPDLDTDMTSLKIWTQYNYRRNIAWKLSYWYEDYSADNWAVDNLQANSIPGLLLMDQETLDYDVHVVNASVIYRFD
jgi:MtrB/PioB family decaheme-associated outer membrane protein